MSGLIINAPASGTRFPKGEAFGMECSNDLPPDNRDEGMASVQFSNGPQQPGDPEHLWHWETARSSGGPVECDEERWGTDFPDFDLNCRFNAPTWARAAAWVAQSTAGDPAHTSPAVRLRGMGNVTHREEQAP